MPRGTPLNVTVALGAVSTHRFSKGHYHNSYGVNSDNQAYQVQNITTIRLICLLNKHIFV